jgi:hypothetical protein
MMIQIQLYAAHDSDLISIAYGGVFDAPTVLRTAIDAFVRRQPPTFTAIPANARLCSPKNTSYNKIALDFHDAYEGDVIAYIRSIPEHYSRNAILKNIIRRMISNDYYYALFDFGGRLSHSPIDRKEIENSLDELESSVHKQIENIKETLSGEEEAHYDFFEDFPNGLFYSDYEV